MKSFDTTGNNCCVSVTFLFWSSIAPLADTCFMVALCLSTCWRFSQVTLLMQGIQKSSSFGVTRNSQFNPRSFSFAFEEYLTRIGGILQLVSYTINPSMPRVQYYTMSITVDHYHSTITSYITSHHRVNQSFTRAYTPAFKIWPNNQKSTKYSSMLENYFLLSNLQKSTKRYILLLGSFSVALVMTNGENEWESESESEFESIGVVPEHGGNMLLFRKRCWALGYVWQSSRTKSCSR